MATHSSILAWRIPWTEEPSKLWHLGSQRVRHDSAHRQQSHVQSIKFLKPSLRTHLREENSEWLTFFGSHVRDTDDTGI